MPHSSAHARPGPASRFRSALAMRWRRASGGGRVAASAVLVLLLALVTTGVVFALSSGSPHEAAGGTTSTRVTTTTKPRVLRHVDSRLCPLTGTPAPGGRVPSRPALGVKIGNDPASRPQTGLPEADIVYEEMAEGGITRYLAIFQCHVPAAIGPVRSVRWDDWHILASYGHPILAFSGGIEPWDAEVASLSWLFDANGSEGTTQDAYYRTSNRIPPWNYYTSGSALWAMDSNHTPPPPQFTYSATVPAGAGPAEGATIAGFATGSDVDWTWSARLQAWLRSYDGAADVDISGAQLHATNVIIEVVQTEPGPYDESGPDSPDVESITEGSGQAWILRNGKVESGTWSCPAYGDLTTYRFADGKAMTLAPGNTWVELVPSQGYPVSIHR